MMRKLLGFAGAIGLFACGSSSAPVLEARGVEPGVTHEPRAATGAASPAETGPEAGDKCGQLAKVCHDHAAASPLVDECHKIGHGGDSSKCEARHDECMSACEAAAKGGAHPHPAGSAASAPHH